MPEIKNTFTQGKMNKDLDERIVPNGQYRDAINIQVSTSEGSDVGAVQNILGNTEKNTIDVNGTTVTIVPTGYECVGSIADEKNDAIYSFITDDSNSAIVEYKKNPFTGIIDINPVLVDLNNGVLNFSTGDIITGINIIDDILLWTDGHYDKDTNSATFGDFIGSEPKKINIQRCKDGTLNFSTHTKLVVDGSIVLDANGVQIDITEEHITVIKKKPLRPLSVKINPADLSDKKPLFEKIFPRFSYRYRYEDGEYSVFAPFTDVVFNSEYPTDNDGIVYDENTAYDVKEPYNAGMRNMIQSVELTDFVSPIIPKDVVQIDLLYKQENSAVVYVVEVIKSTDEEWLSEGLNIASSYKGKFTVESENIYAAVPSNQLLRPWDNVPKIALAQEVTGNRLVYGNYTQSYDLGVTPKVISDYQLRFDGAKHVIDYVYEENLLNNPTFDANWGWTLNPPGIDYDSTNQAIDFNVTVTTGIALYQLRNDFWEGVGTSYKISFDISDYISGDLEVRLTNGIINVGDSGDYITFNVDPSNDPNPNRTWEFIGPMLAGTTFWNGANGRFSIKTKSNGFIGKIDNASVQKQLVEDDTIKTFENGGFPSVKSQRNYQLGVVYGDKYGRETPVFTSSDSSVVIPWDDLTSETPIGVDLPLASFSLQLKASLGSFHPSWADYYKFFVKETSGEYYNLVMDAIYNPTKEDLEEEDHIWMSFASSDRNKISEDDYIIFKKRVGANEGQIDEENKYRVLDVKNEAPDAIKYKYVSLGEIQNNLSNNQGVLNSTSSGLFPEPLFRPFSNNDKNMLHVDKNVWHSLGGARLVDGLGTVDGEQKVIENLYFSFIKVSGPGDNQSSDKKYRVVSIEVAGSSGSEYYAVKLSQSITEKDDTLIRGDATDPNIHSEILIKFEQKLIKDSEAFSGRFFVKILSDDLIKTELETDALNLLEVLYNYKVIETRRAFWHTDTITPGAYDIEAGLINNNGFDGVPSTNNVSLVTGLSAGVTNTEDAWDALLTKMSETGGRRWFIDQMYMVAEQTGQYARHATQGWHGGNPNNIGDVYNSVAGVNVPSSSSWGYYNFGSNPGRMRFPFPNNIKPTNPTTTTNGDNLINGLEGVVTTNINHTGANGIRRWRNINWNKNSTSVTKTNNYGPVDDTGKYYLHISFLAPGSNLHSGNLAVSNSNLDLGPPSQIDAARSIFNNMQGIFGGGVFTSGSQTTFTSWSAVFMEIQLAGNSKKSGYGVVDGVQFPQAIYKHNTQWTLPAADQDFADQFQAGNRFRFVADTTKTIYTILKSNYSNPKKIYNHTPWRKMWKVNTSGVLSGMGNSVEEAATAWADTTDPSGNSGTSSLVDDLKLKLYNFGNKNNRRLVYILELDKDPTDASQNGGYNPVSGGTSMDSITPDTIEFITTDFELNAGEISQNPAIWETEPKDNVDLDIYYEAGQAYPTELSIDNIELFAPVGCRVEFIPSDFTNDVTGGLSAIQEPILLTSWEIDTNVSLSNFTQGDLRFFINTDVNATTDGTHLIEDYGKVRFIREDGSYTESILVQDSGVGDLWPTFNSFSIRDIVPLNTEVGLSWYNCFSFGNGIESDRIRDDFNGMTITNGVRANATLDRPYEEEHRKSGMIYSGIYNSTSGVNNLNQFIMAEKITKDLNPTYGSIQKLFSRRISLIAFCEDRIVGITANKNALYNADGNPQLVATNAVLGDANPFVGDYGISKNPESFASESYRAYFTDKQRGAVLRLSMDGLTPISNAGMSDWFKDEFKKPQYNIIGSYDNYKNDYNLTLDGGLGTPTVVSTTSIVTPPRRTSSPIVISSGDSYTLTYSEDVKGWVSFKSFIQESGVSMSGDYYTFKGGKCWKHDNTTRNTFYTGENGGGTTDSSITFLLNDSPLVIKNYNTLNYDGDENWSCDSIATDQQSGTVAQFIEKEGKWFNYIKGDNTAPLDTKAFNFQGIGVASNIEYSI